MERLTLAAGGVALNEIEDSTLVPSVLGHADEVRTRTHACACKFAFVIISIFAYVLYLFLLFFPIFSHILMVIIILSLLFNNDVLRPLSNGHVCF